MKSKTILFLLLMLALTTSAAYAGGTGGLPFESGLKKVADSLSGPVAISIAIVAFAAAGIMYIFNPDATALIKGLIGLCIAVGVMFGGKVFVDLMADSKGSGNVITQEFLHKEVSKNE